MYREALQIREILVAKISLLLPYLTFLELLFYLIFKNAVQTNGDGDSIFCPMVIKYSIITHHIMTKMLIYFVLPLVLSFSRNRQLKTSNLEKKITFPDGHRHTQTEHLKKNLTYIHMTHVCACVRVFVWKSDIFLKMGRFQLPIATK